MSTTITKQRLFEIIKEELSHNGCLLLENNILNVTLPVGNHEISIFDKGGSDYGLSLDGEVYDMKAYHRGMRFFLRPLAALQVPGGFNISFQPRKARRNIGDPKGGLLPTREFASILNSIVNRGEWSGTFITLDEDGENSEVEMKIEKA